MNNEDMDLNPMDEDTNNIQGVEDLFVKNENDLETTSNFDK